MSREEAHRRPAADRRRVSAEPSATGRITDEVAEPQRPLFTARTDGSEGVVHTRGHLDRIGAELLCGVVTALRQSGHRQIVVRLGSATVDDDARSLLAGHAQRLLADGGVRLHIR